MSNDILRRRLEAFAMALPKREDEGRNAIGCALSALDQLAKERDEARKCLRWAHDTLYEINPSNYDHDEVCKLNDASVEVILGIAPLLDEKHGKTDAWWHSRIEGQRAQLAACKAESAACWKNLVESGRQRDEARTKLAAMQEAIVEAVRRADVVTSPLSIGSAQFVAEPLRPHLPTPEPATVDPLAEAWNAVWQGDYGTEKGLNDLRAALSARGLEVRKIGEGE